MKDSIKAVLLSAFVFPGAGHFYLKKQISGGLFLTAFLFTSYLLMKDLMSKVEYILHQIEIGSIPLDIFSITQSLSNNLEEMSQQTSSLLMLSIGLLWIVSILDAYRIGRRNDYKNQ